MRRDEPNPREAAGDRLLGGMAVERVTRPDGRYLLYYSWPDAEPEAAVPGEREETDGDV